MDSQIQWDLSNEIQSNPMEILSKSHGIHGIHGIYPMKSYQIQWKPYQNLMGFMGFMGFLIFSHRDLMVYHGLPLDFLPFYIGT